MKYYNTLNDEAKRLKETIARKEKYIASAPEGVLRCYAIPDSDRYRWYVSKTIKDKQSKSNTDITAADDSTANNTHCIYLPKKDIELARKLALKGLYIRELRDDKQELRAINMYLSNCSSFERGNHYIDGIPEYARLLGEYYNGRSSTPHYKASHIPLATANRISSNTSINVSEWLANKYTGPVPHPEQLTIMTKAGFKVRSKSEREIVNYLLEYNIPFKYEERIKYNNEEFLFPDFTILSPATGKEILWEHNGSMDDYSYALRCFERAKMYYDLGYHPDKNIIFTYEENNEGIDESWIEYIIHHTILKDDASTIS